MMFSLRCLLRRCVASLAKVSVRVSSVVKGLEWIRYGDGGKIETLFLNGSKEQLKTLPGGALSMVELNGPHETYVASGSGQAASGTGAGLTPLQSQAYSNLFLQFGFGASISGNNDTANYYGPGVGSGGLSTDRSWNPSVTGSLGAFVAFAPNWYGGVVPKISSPPAGITHVAMTSTGVLESSLTTQSGPASSTR